MATNKKNTKDESEEKSTALAVASFEEILPQGVDFQEMLDNLREMDEIDFPRIRVKLGKFFLTEDPNDKGVEEFYGVLLFYGRQNTFWSAGFDKNNITPPDCYSTDGKTGSKAREGNKFGTCADCYYNQFKSHPSGKGKACRNQNKLYILRQGTTVPTTLFIAPTSLGVFNRGFIVDQVTQRGLTYFKVLTKFSAYIEDGETFTRVKFGIEGVYKGDEATQIKELRDFWLPAINRDRQRLEATPAADDDSKGHSAKTTSSGSEDATEDKVSAPSSNKEVVVKPKAATTTATKKTAPPPDDEEEPPF